MKKNSKFWICEKDVMNSLKVITAAGGQNSVTQMIGSLYDAIEDHYGIFASRLYRAFRPKPLKSTATSSWRKMCCLPYAYIYMVCMYVCFPLLIFRSEMFPSQGNNDLP